MRLRPLLQARPGSLRRRRPRRRNGNARPGAHLHRRRSFSAMRRGAPSHPRSSRVLLRRGLSLLLRVLRLAKVETVLREVEVEAVAEAEVGAEDVVGVERLADLRLGSPQTFVGQLCTLW